MWLLILAALCNLLRFGPYCVGPAAWFLSVFLLRFLDGFNPLTGFMIAVVAFFPTTYLTIEAILLSQPQGALPGLERNVLYLTTLATSLSVLFPALCHRTLAPYLPNLLASLVFPSTAVFFNWLVSLLTSEPPHNRAFALHESLELLAVVSVVGSLGLLFLLEWVGSAMALWLGTARATALRPALAALAAALLFGAWDLRVNRPTGPLLRVVATPMEGSFESTPVHRILTGQFEGLQALDDHWLEEMARHEQQQDEFFAFCEAEAGLGADICLGPELALFEEQEQMGYLLERAKAVAKRNRISIALPTSVFYRDTGLFDNSLAVVTRSGHVAGQMAKNNPSPVEAFYQHHYGDGAVLALRTPLGRILPSLGRDLASIGPYTPNLGVLPYVDLALSLSRDTRSQYGWSGLDAKFKAVEFGHNLVHITAHGVSFMADYQGRILSQTGPGAVILGSVPQASRSTLHGQLVERQLGSLLPVLCGLLAIVLSLVACLGTALRPTEEKKQQ